MQEQFVVWVNEGHGWRPMAPMRKAEAYVQAERFADMKRHVLVFPRHTNTIDDITE